MFSPIVAVINKDTSYTSFTLQNKQSKDTDTEIK